MSADALEQILDQIAEVEAILKPLKEKEDEIRDELVLTMQKKGYDSIRTTSGLGFVIVKGRVSFKVKDGKEQDAIAWALDKFPSIVTLAAAKLNKVAQPLMELPEFIERTQGEPHLSVRSTESE